MIGQLASMHTSQNPLTSWFCNWLTDWHRRKIETKCQTPRKPITKCVFSLKFKWVKMEQQRHRQPAAWRNDLLRHNVMVDRAHVATVDMEFFPCANAPCTRIVAAQPFCGNCIRRQRCGARSNARALCANHNLLLFSLIFIAPFPYHFYDSTFSFGCCGCLVRAAKYLTQIVE